MASNTRASMVNHLLWDGKKQSLAQAQAQEIPGRMSPPIPDNSIVYKCTWCKQSMNRTVDRMVLYPGCRHVTHDDCYLVALFIHNIKSCIECKPDLEKIHLDLGDDVQVQEFLLKQRTQQGMQQGKELRTKMYEISTIIGHAREITSLDANQHQSEAGPLPCWVPGLNQYDKVQQLLSMHATPHQLKRAGVDPLIIMNSGYTIGDLLGYRYTIKEIEQIGFDWIGLIAMGLTLTHLERADQFPVADLVRLFHVTYVHILRLEPSGNGTYNSLYKFCGMLFGKEELIELRMNDLHLLVPYGLDSACMIELSNKLSFEDLLDLHMDGPMVCKLGMLRESMFEKMRWPKDHAVICKALKVLSTEIKKKSTKRIDLANAANFKPITKRKPRKTVEYDEDNNEDDNVDDGNGDNSSANEDTIEDPGIGSYIDNNMVSYTRSKPTFTSGFDPNRNEISTLARLIVNRSSKTNK